MNNADDLIQSIPFFYGYTGIAVALVFANLGAAYGTAKAGVGISAMGVMCPTKVIKSVLPVIMAGLLGIYGLIVSVLISQKLSNAQTLSAIDGYKYIGSGLCCGLTSLSAGIAIGIGGDAGVRALGHQDKVFVGMMLILIFAEALGLYGLIVSLMLSQ